MRMTKVSWEYKEDPETEGSLRPYTSCAHWAVSCNDKTWRWKRARTKMTANERGRSIAPTCQNVPLEFKCILFNRWTRPGRWKLWAFFPRVCSSSHPSPPCSTSRPSYWEYSLITCVSLWRTVLHDSTLLRRSPFFRSKRWARRLFRCKLKACREQSCVFRWDQPEKRWRNIPVRRSILSSRIFWDALLCRYILHQLVYSTNRS